MPTDRTVEKTISDTDRENPFPGWTLRLERVKCGKCRKCLARNYAHGPYWYAYKRTATKFHQMGKTTTRYIGKKLPKPRTAEADATRVKKRMLDGLGRQHP